MGRDIDEILRQRILDFVGYGKGFKSTKEIFNYLGWNIDSVQDNAKWYQIVRYEKDAFHTEILEDNLTRLVEGDREVIYRKCLEMWYSKKRLLLYKHPEGWETPKTLANKEQIEQLELSKHISGIVEKAKKMRSLQELIPYNEKTLKALENQLGSYIESLNEKEEKEED